MIKLMIVDDEQIVRDGVKFIIDKEFKGVLKVVATAKSGRESIELFEEERPLIVLMDIQMHGINGIEAIKQIRYINPNVKFIIISAYEQFEYAKQALEIGVNDYILKPITKNKLKEVLNKIIIKIEKEKESKRKEIDIKEKLDKVVPILEYGYIYSILMNSDFTQEICDYQNLLNIRRKHGYIMVIEFEEDRIPTDLKNKIGTRVRNNTQYQKIRNAIKYKCKAVVGPLMVNRIVISIHEEQHINSYEQRVKAIDLAESIQQSLICILDSEVYIGIGSCYKINRLNTSYYEAVKALGKMTGEKVLHIEDAVKNIELEHTYNFIKIKNDEDIIIKKMEEGNIYEVEKKMKVFLNKIHKDYADYEDTIKNIIIELMGLISMVAYRHGLMTKENNDLSYIDDLKQIKEYYNLKNWCIAKAKSITQSIKLEKENKASSVISDAINYIKENYNKELHLKDVAEVVAISPQYFSKIFKEEVGVNFIDYLTTVRIEQAKKMLNEENLSIKEICFKIGYNDPNYFSRLFKKIVGVSPTEYI